MQHPALLPLVMTVGVLSISTAAVFIKRCDDAPAVVIAAARMAIATLVLLAGTAAVRRGRLVSVPLRHRRYVVLAGLFLGAHFFFWISSLKHTSVLSSVVIATSNPIFVAIASHFLFRETIGRRLVAALFIAGAGGTLIALSDAGAAPGSLYGDFLSFCGVLMSSCYMLIGRRVRADVDVVSYMLPVYAVAAVALLAAMLAAGHGPAGCRPETYLYLALLALVPQLLGHGALNWALRYQTATTVTVFILGEPVGASVFAFVFLGETVTPVQALGGALILLAIYVASAPPRLPRWK